MSQNYVQFFGKQVWQHYIHSTFSCPLGDQACLTDSKYNDNEGLSPSQQECHLGTKVTSLDYGSSIRFSSCVSKILKWTSLRGYRNPQKLDFQWLQLHEISMPEGPQICIYTDAALIVTEIFVDALLGHSSSWLQSSPIPIQCFCSNFGFPWPQWSYNQWPSPTDLWSSGYTALWRT